MEELKGKLRMLFALNRELLEDAKTYQFSEEDCPLEDETITGGRPHYDASQMFDGTGCWRWNCPFCGKEFEE